MRYLTSIGGHAAVLANQAVLGGSQAYLSGINCLKPVAKLSLFGLSRPLCWFQFSFLRQENFS